MLATGVYATLEDLAKAKGVESSYVSRVLRLTLLAPEIVDAILDGRQPVEPLLDDLLEACSVWHTRAGNDDLAGMGLEPAWQQLRAAIHCHVYVVVLSAACGRTRTRLVMARNRKIERLRVDENPPWLVMEPEGPAPEPP